MMITLYVRIAKHLLDIFHVAVDNVGEERVNDGYTARHSFELRGLDVTVGQFML